MVFCQSCKAVYDRIIDLKIATPQIIINYGFFLEENSYFEEAFKVISSVTHNKTKSSRLFEVNPHYLFLPIGI